MAKLHYKGRETNAPNRLRGEEIKKLLGIEQNRTVYAILDKHNQLIGNKDTLLIRGTANINDIPYTEKG